MTLGISTTSSDGATDVSDRRTWPLGAHVALLGYWSIFAAIIGTAAGGAFGYRAAGYYREAAGFGRYFWGGALYLLMPAVVVAVLTEDV